MICMLYIACKGYNVNVIIVDIREYYCCFSLSDKRFTFDCYKNAVSSTMWLFDYLLWYWKMSLSNL